MSHYLIDNTSDRGVQDLIAEVFTLNSITYDPLDYAVVKAQEILMPGLTNQFNSYLFLAPLTTSSNLPLLKLPYDRKNIEEVLTGKFLYFYSADEETTVSQLLKQINEILNKTLVLKQKDFYNTYAVFDEQETFVVLYAHPSSVFYRGSYKVPFRSNQRVFSVSFLAEITEMDFNT